MGYQDYNTVHIKWGTFLTVIVGYKPDEPNEAQETMYYTLWEMKDMEKRGADEVRHFDLQFSFFTVVFFKFITIQVQLSGDYSCTSKLTFFFSIFRL